MATVVLTVRQLVALAALVLICPGCDEDEKTDPSGVPTVVTRQDLTPELSQRVLARVGERVITLGDYVAALERMDPFERLRYQTPERRKMLLDEMIDIELLAREAERLGLEDEPETQAYLRQLEREELLHQLRDQQPKLEELPDAEVRAYYDAHLDDFRDPERRRVAVIAVRSKDQAQKILEQLEADIERWGELTRAHSLLKGDEPRLPLELEGDLGFVTAVGVEKGSNPEVPEGVRAAVFEINELGQLHSEVVAEGGRFYVVRLVSRSTARTRSYQEAETTIRVRLLQQRLQKAEQRLAEELRSKFEVHIDEEALAKLRLPDVGTVPVAPSGSSGTRDSTAPSASPRSP